MLKYAKRVSYVFIALLILCSQMAIPDYKVKANQFVK